MTLFDSQVTSDELCKAQTEGFEVNYQCYCSIMASYLKLEIPQKISDKSQRTGGLARRSGWLLVRFRTRTEYFYDGKAPEVSLV